MDDDNLLDALNNLSEHVSTVDGDALCTGMLVRSLILMLIKSDALPAEGVLVLIGATLLSLEKLAHPAGAEGRRHVDHARDRLENHLRLVKGRPMDHATRQFPHHRRQATRSIHLCQHIP